jgi:hypothetical protein
MTILTYSQRILDNLLDENMNITKFTHEQTISDNSTQHVSFFFDANYDFFFLSLVTKTSITNHE